MRAASPKVACREGAVTARSKAVGEPRYEGTYKSAGRRRMLLESSGLAGVLPSFSLAATPLGQPKLRGCPGVRGGGQCARLLHSTARTHTHAKEKKLRKKTCDIWKSGVNATKCRDLPKLKGDLDLFIGWVDYKMAPKDKSVNGLKAIQIVEEMGKGICKRGLPLYWPVARCEKSKHIKRKKN